MNTTNPSLLPTRIEIVDREEKYIKLRLFDDPHTMLNPLNEIIAKRDDVELVGYTREKTFEDVVIFQLRMKENATTDPLTVIRESLDILKTQIETFKEAFQNRNS